MDGALMDEVRASMRSWRSTPPHAAGDLSRVAQAAFGAGSREAAAWRVPSGCHRRPRLEAGDPREVLAAIRGLPMPTPEALEVRAQALRYLTARLAQIRYADVRRRGYPIGSGRVESGDKLAVEARLTGAGMTPRGYPARGNMTPMAALRGVSCSGCWAAAWPGTRRQLRERVAERRRQGRERRAEREAAAAAVEQPAAAPAQKRPPPEPRRVVGGRPPQGHPWHHGYVQRTPRRARGRVTAKS